MEALSPHHGLVDGAIRASAGGLLWCPLWIGNLHHSLKDFFSAFLSSTNPVASSWYCELRLLPTCHTGTRRVYV
eukprot:scaffold87167_cov56-Attheya_sp.AAC.2